MTPGPLMLPLDNKRMNDPSYRSPKTEVRESPIHGKGLFAKQEIAAGEVVAVKGGHILTKQEWTTLEQQLGPAEIQISEELFIAPTGEEQREGCMLYIISQSQTMSIYSISILPQHLLGLFLL